MKKSTASKKPKPQPLKRINLVYLRESAAKEARDLALQQEKRDLTSTPPPPGYRAVDYNAYREQQLQAEDVLLVCPNNEEAEIMVSSQSGMKRHNKA